MNSKNIFVRVFWGIVTGILIGAAFLAGIILIAVVVPVIAKYLGDIAALIAVAAGVGLLYSSPVFIVKFMKYITRKDRPTLKELFTLSKVPHFGGIMPRCLREIHKETFHPYMDLNGNENPDIMISESGRWLRLFGKYYPMDFICGYSPRFNVFYAIDGATISLPKKAKNQTFQSDLEALFEAKGNIHDRVPKGAQRVFGELIGGNTENLHKADFGKLRVMWESSLSGSNDPQKDVFIKVLSGNEIKRLANTIKKGNKRLGDYLSFGEYQNDYSVCNGIKLLGKLGYPKNNMAIDFLFDCLDDIDEPYFMPAVEGLMRYQREDLEKRIEERARSAYENEEVLKMAGIMFLAKQMDYEIKCVSEIKKAAMEQMPEEMDFEAAWDARYGMESMTGMAEEGMDQEGQGMTMPSGGKF